ncbi:tetratricopeptide repeat protein, partial [Thiolapillus sp.]|uniref:tetratricopeptide repeat protein n=2 Tax=Thiolapillus sp. TaxID=2017437 RepID=UPI003AF5A848
AGARVAANLLPSKLLSAYADVVRLEADPAFFSLTKLRTLREAVETFGLQYAWHDLGFALYKQDDLDGAINAYRQQLKAKPDHEGAWYNLGVALDKQGDPDGAIDAYRQQIKVKPDHPWAWNNLGSALGKQGDPDGAIDAFRQQIKVNPDHEVAWNNLGIVLYDQCNPDSAIKAFRQQIKVNPNHEEAWYNLGSALGKQGNLDGAIEAFRQQLEINPDHEWAWNNLGAALGTQDNLDDAINAFRQQIKVNPNHEEAWYNLGGSLGKQGNLDGAIEAFRKLLEINPDHESAWYNLGIVLGKQGDLDGAINAYRQGMQHPLIKGQCHNALAWLYYEQQQNLDEAVELARTAVELDPEAPDARHTLATLLISSGNWAEAQIEATAFLQLGEPDWLETGWEDLLRFFLEAVRHNRATESVRLLEDTKSTERLRPLYVALKTLAEGPDQLTQVAPEVRQPAQALIKQFNEWLAAMESDAAASSPQSPRGGVD